MNAREWFLSEPGNRIRVTGDTVRQTEEAMRLTAQGRCPFCKSIVEDGEQCPCWNKEND